MRGGIDDIFISRVRDANSIAEVIGDYVNLKAKGRGDLWGLCPFHHEKTSSFHVHLERGIFKCFGCGRGGNAITFIMEIEGLSFIEALKTLAERAGIEFPDTNIESVRESRTERERILIAMQVAMNYYHSKLKAAIRAVETGASESKLRQSPDSLKALEYLQRRGIDKDIIHRFKLGWADSGWDGLVKYALNKREKGQILVQAGLASKKRDGGGYVDRFRARIIFPITNLSGKVIAFGARKLEGVTPDSDPAKYINSPETAVYRKGEHLYGLYEARETIRKENFAYMVEGYTDLLALIKAGINNVVASLGTSLTQSQARLLYRFTKRVHLVYDSDTAGVNAAVRAADILTQEKLETRIIKLPQGEDPDSTYQSIGAEGLQRILSETSTFIEFRMSVAGFDVEMSQSERVEAARGVLETIKGIPDPLYKDILIQELSDISGITREALEKALTTLRPTINRSPDEANVQKIQISRETKPERDLIQLLLGQPLLITEFMKNLNPDQFVHKEIKQVFLSLEQVYLQGESIDVQSFPEKFERPEIRGFIVDAILSGENLSFEKAREATVGCILALKRRDILKRTRQLQIKLNEANRNKQPTKDLLKELVELSRQMNSDDLL